jgi:glutamate-1-semialdehyde 2,1-aminomutase
MTKERLVQSEALLERAKRVIPGGIYGHQSPAMLVGGAHPYFFERGEGSHVWDVDGNEYIDYMCSYGPIVLGHNHPRVDEAALARWRKGDVFNGPGKVWVELAERLVGMTPFADWAAFAKNGSDVCTWAVAVAREHTGRRKVVMARGSYHGAHAWCTPMKGGVTPEDRLNVLTFPYNSLADLQAVVEENRDQVAAIIVTPFKHDAFAEQEMPADGFLPGVRKLCDEHGIVFALDDVRAGFRLHLGGSGEAFGVRPDIACYAKAIANGYPLSACVGREFLRSAAEHVYFTGSYFTATVPMAAALACLDELEASGAVERMRVLGTRLQRTLEEQSRSHGVPAVCTGPPAMPFLTFREDQRFARNRIFAGACAERGVYLAPYHNWFLSAAHTDADIDRTLDVTDQAFACVRRAAD